MKICAWIATSWWGSPTTWTLSCKYSAFFCDRVYKSGSTEHCFTDFVVADFFLTGIANNDKDNTDATSE
jgi:hypothetical protein